MPLTFDDIAVNPSWIVPYFLISFLVVIGIANYFYSLYNKHKIVYPYCGGINHNLRICMVEKLVETNDIIVAVKRVRLDDTIKTLLREALAAELSYRDVTEALNSYTETNVFSWSPLTEGIRLNTPNGEVEFIWMGN